MKRFLIAVIGLAAVLLSLWLCTLYFGFYIDFYPDAPVEVPFLAEDGALCRRMPDGALEPLSLRAVDVSASMPGHPFSDYEPEEADYLRWFEYIGEMGANAVQTDAVMDADFYNALYAYEVEHPDQPLWFIQCLSVSDLANYGKEDAYAEDFIASLLRDGKTAVDIIHGNRNTSVGTNGAVGSYRRDISPWTLGYIVGYEWSDGTVAYTDHSIFRASEYAGRYLSAPEGASRFEVMLAQVMDGIVSYEASKYKEQRLISFANGPTTDPFTYDPVYAAQLPKFSAVDGEHLSATDYSGFFLSYRLYDFCSDPLSLFSTEQLAALGRIPALVDRSAPYGGYLELLECYHTAPVYIMGYGFSTARAPVSEDQSLLTEEEQGESLVRIWREAVSQGLAGVCISSWQDAWERRTWNVSFATDLTRSTFWHDLQCDGQNYGLLDFEPGEAPVCLLDGDPSEWDGDDVILSAGDMTLSARYDAEGLWLMITGDKLAERNLYLPIDLTDKSGSPACRRPARSFDRAADFLLCLEGPARSRFLVQERYDAFLENFGETALGRNPFFDPPEPDTDVFHTARVVVNREKLLNAKEIKDAEALAQSRLEGIYETGRLVHGCGDPESPNYNSLADFCYGENCVEVRLPWLLLNVSDPSQMQIHQDYYEVYGVVGMPADTIWIGLGGGTEPIALAPLELEGWDALDFRERLKRSYYILQGAWRDGER